MVPLMPQPVNQNSEKRKSNKPEMERRRRERMNNAMDQLKELILIYENKDVTRFAKMEKADLLEHAVRHVERLHETIPPAPRDPHQHFKAGYQQCMSDVLKLLHQTAFLPPEVKQDIMANLETSLSNSVPKAPTMKVRATLDASVFNADVLRLEPQRAEQPESLHKIEPLPEINVHSYPAEEHGFLTPPESRESSSPRSTPSPRSSPNSFMHMFPAVSSIQEGPPVFKWVPKDTLEHPLPINLSTNRSSNSSECGSPNISPIHSPAAQEAHCSKMIQTKVKRISHRTAPYPPKKSYCREIKCEPKNDDQSVWRPF